MESVSYLSIDMAPKAASSAAPPPTLEAQKDAAPITEAISWNDEEKKKQEAFAKGAEDQEAAIAGQVGQEKYKLDMLKRNLEETQSAQKAEMAQSEASIEQMLKNQQAQRDQLMMEGED